MNEANRIVKVADNQDKYQTYKTQLGRYQRAMKYGFHLEALWILYAMAEDRTSAFLYCLGLVSEDDRSKRTPTQAIQKDWKNIQESVGRKGGFNTFALKLEAIRLLMDWSLHIQPDSAFQKDICGKLQKLKNQDRLVSSLAYLDLWKGKRNQLVHALFSKNKEAVEEELTLLAEEGYRAVRVLDEAVRQLKRSVDVRAKYGIC